MMSTFNLANSAENRTNRSEADARDERGGPVYPRRLLNVRRAGEFRPSSSRIAESIGELHLRACRAQAAQRTRLWTAIETGPPRRRRRRAKRPAAGTASLLKIEQMISPNIGAA